MEPVDDYDLFVEICLLFGDQLDDFLHSLSNRAYNLIRKELNWEYQGGLGPRCVRWAGESQADFEERARIADLPFVGLTVRKGIFKEWQEMEVHEIGLGNIMLLRTYLLWKKIPERVFNGDVDKWMRQKMSDIQICCWFTLVDFTEYPPPDACRYITGMNFAQVFPFFHDELGLNFQLKEGAFEQLSSRVLESARRKKCSRPSQIGQST